MKSLNSKLFPIIVFYKNGAIVATPQQTQHKAGTLPYDLWNSLMEPDQIVTKKYCQLIMGSQNDRKLYLPQRKSLFLRIQIREVISTLRL